MPSIPALLNNTSKRRRITFLLGCLVILALLLAACGGAAIPGSSAPVGAPANYNGSSSQANAPSTASGNSNSSQSSKFTVGQYQIKALSVSMMVKDTLQVSSDLQNWIAATDPRSSSAGADYEQVGDNFYNVSLRFSVEASMYPQIKSYLENYTLQHGGKLVSLQETVQDVTNDVIDSQSRLKNLRGEQQRLLTLMSNATALGDILTIEHQLTDVEGQIEDLEAHINALNGQTTYYSVSITLQPIVPVVSTPAPAPPGWSAIQTLKAAWSASLQFGQMLLTIAIWLLSFSIYIIPAGAIIWLIWQRKRLRSPFGVHIPPIVPAPTPQTPSNNGPMGSPNDL